MAVVLIIDDEANFRDAVIDYLSGDDNLTALGVATGAEGLQVCSSRSVDVVLLDERLPDVDGTSLCKPILENDPRTKIIFSTAYPSFDHVLSALRQGAYDYLPKPINLDELQHVLDRALRVIELEQIEALDELRAERDRNRTVLIGSDGGLNEVNALALLAAKSNAPVLVTGETGTGKTILARYIHYSGEKASGPFIAVNAAAIPRELMESELFGHEQGAFTGATSKRRGIFELAHGGTLFLDEIGSLSLELQTKLLSVLDDKTVRRVGSERSIEVDVRVISATNTDLRAAIEKGQFREDLYYRLNVINIHLPPLRERKADIPALTRHFAQELSSGRKVSVEEEELTILCEYSWPGNVRELRNIIERAIALQRDDVLQPSRFLQASSISDKPQAEDTGGATRLEEIERRHIMNVLGRCEGNHAKASRLLGISESTLRRRLKAYSAEKHSD